jgi:hypothetical protein
MLYARDNILMYSEPYAYEIIDPRFYYIPFTSKIVMIASTSGGVYVGTESEVLFFNGDDIHNVKAKKAYDNGVVSGTKRHISGSLIGDGETDEPLPVFMSKNGICVGLPSGAVQNVTERAVNIPAGVVGTAMFRHQNEQNHYVAVINS